MSLRSTASSRSSKSGRTARAFDAMELLEHRQMFSTYTGHGWQISEGDGAQITSVEWKNNHLIIHQTTDSFGTLIFKKTTDNPEANFFGLDIQATNTSVGPANQFSLSLVDYQDSTGRESNKKDHPAWAHFHVNADHRETGLSNVAPGVPYPTGAMTSVILNGGEVAKGASMRVGGGAAWDKAEGGYRIHWSPGYAYDNANGFSLWESLGWKINPDRFESNNSPSTASDLGTISSRREDHLTITNQHFNADVDYYKFTADSTGKATIDALFSHALGDVNLAVLNSNQNVLGSSNSTADNEHVTLDVQAGQTYYVKVNTPSDWYGAQRDYSLAVNIAQVQPPEINLYETNGSQITFSNGKTFDLGSFVQGSAGGSMNFKVRNDGGGVLTLGTGSMPEGISVEGLASQLTAGQEDEFTVRVNPAKVGTFEGKIILTSNDPDESLPVQPGFPLKVKYAVRSNHVPAPEINLYETSGTQITFVGNKMFDLGSIVQNATSGGSMDFKVRNDGDAQLTMNLKSVPDGFKVEGLATSLNPGQEDVFTVKIDASKSPAKRSGKILIASNDPDESQGFPLNVTGKITEQPKPPQFATVRGRLFNDKNGNGKRDGGEKDLSGWRVYYDANQNKKADQGDQIAITDSKGRWSISNIPGGRREFRVAPPVNSNLLVTGKWKPTTPKNGSLTLNLNDGQTMENRLFGVKLI